MKLGWSMAVALTLAAGVAEAQQPAPPAGEAKPTPAQPKAPPPLRAPDMHQGLPPGHPPITGTPGKDQGSNREMLERLRELRQRAQEQARRVEGKGAPASAPQQPRFPRDEHGHCVGQGPNDRPADINLVHGWLGTNNEQAVPPPRPKGSLDWWKWRLTPYPFRYHASDACDPQNQPVPLIANVVNLGVLVFLLFRFGKKPMREALEKRRARIMAEIDRARDIRKSAKTRLMRYEDELDHLQDKLVALREQYTVEGEAEEKRLLGDLAETRERMLADADFRIAQESKQARDELSREALDSALAAAEELLQTSVTTEDHERLCEEYLEQIGTVLRAKQVLGSGGAA